MRLRRRTKKRRVGFYFEEDEFESGPTMVGSLFSDWGPSDAPRHWPWQKETAEPTKPAFGFARALEDNDE